MIPQAYITEWSNTVPWHTNEQIEQDLVICRALVEIFSDEWLFSSLAFRGGTALHKLYLQPQLRYSEDAILKCYHEYMRFSVEHLPTQKMYLQNIEAKMKDDEFIGDIKGLIRTAEKYNPHTAYEMVLTELLEKIEESNPAKHKKATKYKNGL